MENTNTLVTIDGRYIMKANLKSLDVTLMKWAQDTFGDFLNDMPEPRKIVGVYHNPPTTLNITTEVIKMTNP